MKKNRLFQIYSLENRTPNFVPTCRLYYIINIVGGASDDKTWKSSERLLVFFWNERQHWYYHLL